MRTSSLITSLLLFAFTMASASATELIKADFADTAYQSRKQTEMTNEEQAIVGKWAAENREVKWEIERFADGTYEIVLQGNLEGDDWTDFGRGIWGIKNGSYYYCLLESSWLDCEFSQMPDFEKVCQSSDSEFLTSRPGLDDEILYSREKRVEQFSMPLWEKYRP